MATWVNISNSNLQPGAPARSVDAIALRDNPIALAEGAVGAPRIQTAAIADLAVTGAKIANGTITGAKIAGNTIHWNRLDAASIYAGMGAIAAGAVGSYAMVARSNVGSGSPIVWGDLVPGSMLVPSNSAGQNGGSNINQLSGTWRILGSGIPVGDTTTTTLALRVS